jgi:hypothetical protein
LHTWSKEAYEAASRASGGAGDASGEAGGPETDGSHPGAGDPNVVDAEFEKVDDTKK